MSRAKCENVEGSVSRQPSFSFYDQSRWEGSWEC